MMRWPKNGARECLAQKTLDPLIEISNVVPTQNLVSVNGYLLGRPDLDLFEAHYFLALLGHD